MDPPAGWRLKSDSHPSRSLRGTGDAPEMTGGRRRGRRRGRVRVCRVRRRVRSTRTDPGGGGMRAVTALRHNTASPLISVDSAAGGRCGGSGELRESSGDLAFQRFAWTGFRPSPTQHSTSAVQTWPADCTEAFARSLADTGSGDYYSPSSRKAATLTWYCVLV